VVIANRDAARAGRFIAFVPETGTIGAGVVGSWHPVCPTNEGRPSLQGGRLVRAYWHERVLAALVAHADGRKVIHAFAVGGDGRSLGEQVVARDLHDFALSRDGRRLAWRVGSRQLLVRDVASTGPPSLLTSKGRVHPDLRVQLGRTFLTVKAGRHSHVIQWTRGVLSCYRHEGELAPFVLKVFGWTPPCRDARPGGDCAGVVNDPTRFFAAARFGRLTALVDRFGHIVLFDETRSQVCVFHVFRTGVAAWTPDGTRVGPVHVIGGASTPGGGARIGASLLAASGPGGSEEAGP
jgi:hypothetical protein